MEKKDQEAPKTVDNGNGNDENLVSISKEEYEKYEALKKNYSDSTREAQELKAIADCGSNDKLFFKYYNSNKKLAERIAKHYGYEDAEALATSLKETYGDDVSVPLSTDDIKKSANEEVQRELAKQDLESFISKKGLKKGEKSYTTFMSEFQDLMQGKDFNRDNVKNMSKKAWKLVLDDNIDMNGTPVLGKGGKSGSPAPEKEADSIFDMYKKKQ